MGRSSSGGSTQCPPGEGLSVESRGSRQRLSGRLHGEDRTRTSVEEAAGAATVSRSCQEMTNMSEMWCGYIPSEPFFNPFSSVHL